MDFKEHNAEVKAVWDSFYAGKPIRMPVVVGTSNRYYMMNRKANPNNVGFYEYTHNPRLMFDMQAQFAKYYRTEIPGDHEMGTPEEGWDITIDLQNYYEAGWYGCEIKFPDGEVPYAVPMLNDDNKNMLFEKGLPDSFGSWMGMIRDYYELFTEYAQTFELDGVGIHSIGAPFLSSDGVFTVACELRGADNLCVDMMLDPDYYHTLMQYLTDATIKRIQDGRRYLGMPLVEDAYYFADDSIALISHEAYKEFVLPYHKQVADALSTQKERGFVHLCGDATRHFKTIRDEMNIYTFDTGFPVKHAALAKELGEEVTIMGGIKAQTLKEGTPEQIEAITKEIIESVKPVTKRFVYREGNDIAPYTSIENMNIMCDAVKKYGAYK